MITTLSLLGIQDRGACRDHDPELFFPVTEAGPAAEQQIAQAKVVCQGCPVLVDCRAYALATGPDGIWGGMTETERRAIRKADAASNGQGNDSDDAEQQPGEGDQPEPSPVLPSYTSARQSLTRARRALDLAEHAGDPAKIERAERRVATAERQFAAVRAQSASGAVA